MKKELVLILLFGLVVLPAWAQTTSTATSTQALVDSLKALIAQLQNQIKELQAKVQALVTARQQVRESIGEVKETLEEIKDLRKGMTAEEIRAIQQILAADPSIYPEGLITGYFGPATEKALERFRERYRIKEEEREKIGEKTLEKIRELLQERLEIKLEDGKKCVIVPPGHLIAPGFLKKTSTSTPTSTISLPECQVLPKGIEKLLRIGLPAWDRVVTSTTTSTPSTSTSINTSTPTSTSTSTN